MPVSESQCCCLYVSKVTCCCLPQYILHNCHIQLDCSFEFSSTVCNTIPFDCVTSRHWWANSSERPLPGNFPLYMNEIKKAIVTRPGTPWEPPLGKQLYEAWHWILNVELANSMHLLQYLRCRVGTIMHGHPAHSVLADASVVVREKWDYYATDAWRFTSWLTPLLCREGANISDALCGGQLLCIICVGKP